jgi:hypothetical protein
VTTTTEYLASNNGNNTVQHWYPVQWGFFGWEQNYIGLLPPEVRLALADKRYNLRLLFYYHEGDSPAKIKARLDHLCEQHGLSTDVYRLVSGNTVAAALERCCHFNDHELLYYMRNRATPAKPVKFLKTGVPMRQSFLLLSRLHKWWRAMVVTDLQRQGLLRSAVWSYNTLIASGDRAEDCPVGLDLLDIRSDIEQFLSAGPYTCDDLSAAAHNDHTIHVQSHYDSTACSIVLETLFATEFNRGTFLTEKTWKCIKHGHPFVLFAPQGSLAALRDMGYRTFDSVIDNRYDTLDNNTQRYLSVVRCIHKLSQWDPIELYNACVPDLQHNQQVFLASKYNRLNTLWETLHNE